MKNPIALLALFAALAFAPTVHAFAQTPHGDVDRAGNSKAKVKPGEVHTNSDGVTVSNSDASSGNAYVTPKTGTENAKSTIRTETGFNGEITGIDNNDNVDLSSSAEAAVEGSGGRVKVGGGSTVKVSNTGPTGGGDITVDLPSGTTLTVPPGSSTTITT